MIKVTMTYGVTGEPRKVRVFVQGADALSRFPGRLRFLETGNGGHAIMGSHVCL